MFSAHLVFGDINGHSRLPLRRRVDTLQTFWDICARHRPLALANNAQSFYDLDNDCLMAGFSELNGLTQAMEVILWTVELSQQLAQAKVNVSFGVYLVSEAINWRTEMGYNERAGEIHMPDDVYTMQGRVVRSRLAGDCLIVAKRLVELAKASGLEIALAARPGRYLGNDAHHLLRNLAVDEGVTIEEITDGLNALGRKKAAWLRSQDLHVFGLSFADQRARG
jgi:hypothetical protein